MIIKKCSRCLKHKEITEFRIDYRYAGGRKTWCKSCCREYDATRKRMQRSENTPYAQRVRIAKRSKPYKAKRQAARLTDNQRAKARKSISAYRSKDENKIKLAARSAAASAIRKGILIRPKFCQRCNAPEKFGIDGRTLLRADHFMGYAPEHHLTVQWVCTDCDGDLERLRKIPDSERAVR